MDILDVWNDESIFAEYNFSNIDRKVKAIQKRRLENPIYDEIIKELNNRIDIDYVKYSEEIEGNQIRVLKDIRFDEDLEELYDTDIFNKKVKPSQIDDFYLGQYRTTMKNGRLTIYKKDHTSGNIQAFSCGLPKHLKALKNTFAVARKDQEKILKGEYVPINSKFIENIHETMFEDYIQINTRLNKTPGQPHIKPEGYGKFRRTININGAEHKYNVEVDGAVWAPTDSDHVVEEMDKLIKCYNSSNLHPIIKAVLFKTCFIKIHPFRDGNGRVSRLLLNYMLIRNGIPTVTIRGTNKDSYFYALDEAIEKQDFSHLIKLVKTELNKRCNQYIVLYNKFEQQKNLTKEESLSV